MVLTYVARRRPSVRPFSHIYPGGLGGTKRLEASIHVLPPNEPPSRKPLRIGGTSTERTSCRELPPKPLGLPTFIRGVWGAQNGWKRVYTCCPPMNRRHANRCALGGTSTERTSCCDLPPKPPGFLALQHGQHTECGRYFCRARPLLPVCFKLKSIP